MGYSMFELDCMMCAYTHKLRIPTFSRMSRIIIIPPLEPMGPAVQVVGHCSPDGIRGYSFTSSALYVGQVQKVPLCRQKFSVNSQ